MSVSTSEQRVGGRPPARPTADASARFARSFGAVARAVRSALVRRELCTGATAGATASAACLAALYVAGVTPPPWVGAVVCMATTLGGAALAALNPRRARWSDDDVALHLDARLGTNELIVTALDKLRRQEGADGSVDRGASGAGAPAEWGRAVAALEDADNRTWAVASVKRAHLIAVAALAVHGWLAVAPRRTVQPPSPGMASARAVDAEALERVEALAALRPTDPEEAERLRALAAEARRLREDIAKGLTEREALDRLARLKDGIAAERLALGEGERRGGMESAQAELRNEPSTRQAADALGRKDLVALDAEMERLANARERDDRERARKALERARQAAGGQGAPDVQKALDEAAERFDERSRRAELLRDLAESMESAGAGSEALREQRSALDRSRSDADAQALANALADALDKLTPEERERVAKALAGHHRSADGRSAKDPATDGVAPPRAEDLANTLRELARAQAESESLGRQRALDDAREGAERAEGQGSGAGSSQAVPVPRPGSAGASGGNETPAPPGGPQHGGGPGGGGRDTGTADHAGRTESLPAGTLSARAAARIQPGLPGEGTVTSRVPGQAGARASTPLEGTLGAARARELGALEQSDVPEEYREHVRKYFAR